ncbi:Auxin-induced protein 5NG4 [Hordeum vulgare]|nr:Auxin-induced protein 5NG4 [Hordeum vulgare]
MDVDPMKELVDKDVVAVDSQPQLVQDSTNDNVSPQEPTHRSHAVHRANLPLPPTVSEILYPAGVYVESTLHVWAISRWSGAREFTDFFLGTGYGHLPRVSPRMYRVQEVIHNGVVVTILAHFTNPLDAFYLLGRVFSCGFEFIAFTTHNIFTDYDNMFPTAERMHTLSYPINNTVKEH